MIKESKSIKYIILIALFFIANNEYSYSECKSYINKRGDSYWYHNIVNGTLVISDSETERRWKSGSDINNCYVTPQVSINDPTLRFLGSLNALWKLSENLDSINSFKIRKLTGVEFTSTEQMQDWLRENRSNLFWSYERNKMIVLEGGFTCRGVNSASGAVYWKKLALETMDIMDTSATQRLWRDRHNHSRCYITPLESINSESDRLSGYGEAINSIIESNDGKLKVDSRVNEMFRYASKVSGRDFKSYNEFVQWLNSFRTQ